MALLKSETFEHVRANHIVAKVVLVDDESNVVGTGSQQNENCLDRVRWALSSEKLGFQDTCLTEQVK